MGEEGIQIVAPLLVIRRSESLLNVWDLVVCNTKFLSFPIFQKETTCTKSMKCGYLENCAEEVPVLFLLGAATCNFDGKLAHDGK